LNTGCKKSTPVDFAWTSVLVLCYQRDSGPEVTNAIAINAADIAKKIVAKTVPLAEKNMAITEKMTNIIAIPR
jgi:hypothetical protein